MEYDHTGDGEEEDECDEDDLEHFATATAHARLLEEEEEEEEELDDDEHGHGQLELEALLQPTGSRGRRPTRTSSGTLLYSRNTATTCVSSPSSNASHHKNSPHRRISPSVSSSSASSLFPKLSFVTTSPSSSFRQSPPPPPPASSSSTYTTNYTTTTTTSDSNTIYQTIVLQWKRLESRIRLFAATPATNNNSNTYSNGTNNNTATNTTTTQPLMTTTMLMNRYRTTTTPIIPTPPNSQQRAIRNGSGSGNGTSTTMGNVRCHPRMRYLFILLIVLILFSMVLNIWERSWGGTNRNTDWNDGYTTKTNYNTNGIHTVDGGDTVGTATGIKTTGNNVGTTTTTAPPSISPTITITENDDTTSSNSKYSKNDDDDGDNSSNSKYSKNDDDDDGDNSGESSSDNDTNNNVSPLIVPQLPSTINNHSNTNTAAQIRNRAKGTYFSVYDAYNRTQQSSTTTSTTTTTGGGATNSFITWFHDSVSLPNRNNNNYSNHKMKVRSGTEFVKQWCDLTGTTWYPVSPTTTTAITTTTANNQRRKKTTKNNEEITSTNDMNSSSSTLASTTAWQLRAPYFLLPGAIYSGTVYLSHLLHLHPQIVPTRTKELQFFHDTPFRKYTTHSVPERTFVKAARQRMYARDYNIPVLQRNASLISFDATPGYLYHSSVLPRRILCVEPWIKLVVLLRNPIDRLLEQYYARYNSSPKQYQQLSLDDCLQQEFDLMNDVGLLNGTMNQTFYGSEEEDIAWNNYQTRSIRGGLIGRSMYVIQLRHWIATFRFAGGRLPSQSILVVLSENFVLQPQMEYNRIVQFMNLSPYNISQSSINRVPISLSHQTRYVSNETRQILEDFFVPYNKQLKRLLYKFNISSSLSS